VSTTDVHIHVHVHNEPDGLAARVTALEEQIMTVAEDLNALNAQVTEFVEDVNARVAALEAAQGEFTAEGQVAFDALKATVEGGVAGVGDADGDGNPPII
jgi:outer membrane murein-binding lipoprotein Lpp